MKRKLAQIEIYQLKKLFIIDYGKIYNYNNFTKKYDLEASS